MMKYLLIASLLWVAEPLFPFNDIAKTNALIKEAKEALENERYEEAAENYRVLLDSFGMDDSQLKLNMAHALLKSDKKEEAKNIYRNLSGALDAAHRSIANQQLGNLAIENEELDEAINFYKSALKANPENEEARYNYELAKKLKEKQEQEQEQNQDQQEQEQEQQEGEEEKEEGEQGESEEEQQEQEKGEENEETGEEQQQEGEAEEETSEENENPENQEEKTEEQQRMENMQNLKEKLEEMEMNEETAMMILEALRNQEIQYLQQMRRKATQNRKSGKPDW